MVVCVDSLGLQGIEGYGVRVECDLAGGSARLRAGGAARRRRQGGQGAGAGRHPQRGLQIPGLPDHRQPLPRRPAQGGHGVRPAHSAGHPEGLRRSGRRAGGVRLCGGGGPHRPGAPGAGHAVHGPGRPGAGVQRLFVPADNAPEATLAGGLEVYPVESVQQLLSHLTGREPISPAPAWEPSQRSGTPAGLCRRQGPAARQAGTGDRRRRGATIF